MTKLEEVARAIVNEVQAVAFDDIPERASYIERKTHVDRPILDRDEARAVAHAAIKALENPGDEFLERLHNRIYSGSFSATETYPVQREFIRAFIDTILSQKEQGK